MTLPEDDDLYNITPTISTDEKVVAPATNEELEMPPPNHAAGQSQVTVLSENRESGAEPETSQLKGRATNFLFVLSVSLTQVLGEYLISGYGVLLPSLLNDFSDAEAFRVWLASSLTIVSACTTLPISRVVDVHGGYSVFLGGDSVILVWSMACAFAPSSAVVVLCRAMQEMGVAALQPAVFSLVGTRYPAGRQRNIALGICGAAAPLGFFLGIATSGLAVTYATWRVFFFVPAAMSLVSMILMHASALDQPTRPDTVPSART